jgi:hypothetical protein
MPNLTAVHVTSGIPDQGTGTVSTIDQLLAVGLTVTATINQGGAAISSTNGTYENLLLGNVAISTSNALPVQAISSQLAIGNVGGKTSQITVTPTVTISNSYGTNFVMGGLLTFTSTFTSTGSGVVQSVYVTVKKQETQGFTLILFNSNPSNTTWTDAAVAAISTTDVPTLRAVIPLQSSNVMGGTATVAFATGLGISMNVGTANLFGVLLSNAALTNNLGSTSDITVTVDVLQDC